MWRYNNGEIVFFKKDVYDDLYDKTINEIQIKNCIGTNEVIGSYDGLDVIKLIGNTLENSSNSRIYVDTTELSTGTYIGIFDSVVSTLTMQLLFEYEDGTKSTGDYFNNRRFGYIYHNENKVIKCIYVVIGAGVEVNYEGHFWLVKEENSTGNLDYIPKFIPKEYAIINKTTWYGETIVTYGDSQTEQNKWQGYLESILGLTTVNFGHGGYPIAVVDEQNLGFALCSDYMLEQLSAKITENNAKAVTIMGFKNDFGYDGTKEGFNNILIGVNESTDLRTAKGALKRIIEYILTNHPTVIPIIMSPIGGLTNEKGKNLTSPLVNNNGNTLADFSKASWEIADYIGVPFINVFRDSGITIYNSSTYIEDGVHLIKETGGKRVANVVINGLIKNEQRIL